MPSKVYFIFIACVWVSECVCVCVSISLLRKDDVYMYVSCLSSGVNPSQFATALVTFVTTHPGIDDASGKLAILRSVIRDSTSADTDNATASKHVLQRKANAEGQKWERRFMTHSDDTLCNHDDYLSINRYKCDSDMIKMSGSEAMAIWWSRLWIKSFLWHAETETEKFPDWMTKCWNFLFGFRFTFSQPAVSASTVITDF